MIQPVLKRIVAAVIDFMLLVGVILIVVTVLGYDFELVLASSWQSNVICFGSLAFIEAILAASWGKTPGMALFGLKAINADGSKLSFGKSFLRALMIFVLGSAAGIPFYGLIYLAWAVNLVKLAITGRAFWDDFLHTVVQGK